MDFAGDADMIKMAVAKRHEGAMMKMFPMAFTGVSVMVFMIPSFTLYHIMQLPAVNYLIKVPVELVFVVPFIILVFHGFHMTHGPSKYATPVAFLIPAILLMTLGILMNGGGHKYMQALYSIDCDMLPQKAHLQLEWEAASSFFKTCTTDTATKHSNFTAAFLASNFRIQDCTEYETVRAQHADSWGFLQSLEENYACTGFCIPGQQLWSKGPHKDSCSVAVSMIFKYFVQPRSEKVFLMMLLTMILTLIGFGVLAPMLKKWSD
jgi:hypothetical protein